MFRITAQAESQDSVHQSRLESMTNLVLKVSLGDRVHFETQFCHQCSVDTKNCGGDSCFLGSIKVKFPGHRQVTLVAHHALEDSVEGFAASGAKPTYDQVRCLFAEVVWNLNCVLASMV